MHMVFKFGIILGIVQLRYCQVLPVDKCHLEDSTCMKTVFQKAIPIFAGGLPDQGVEVLDVLNMKDYTVDMAGLKFTLKEGKMIGLKTAMIDNVTWNTKKKTSIVFFLVITFHLDCVLKGHYTANGQILVLPITGDGQMKMTIKNIEIHIVMSYNVEKGAEGKDYAILKKHTFEYDTKGNIRFGLTNLFNGNKGLSATMLDFLNKNWKQIDVEFGRTLVGVAVAEMYKNTKAYLSNNVLSDIAII